ncbi:MAG: hypothetical protein ACLT38_01790 [Akkermansia sp.]
MDNIGPLGCLVAISGLYLICSILTEMISVNAVAAVMGPSGLRNGPLRRQPHSLHSGCHVRRQRQLLHPIGYQTNTYVYNAGGYNRTSSKWDSPQPAPLGHFYLRHRLVVSAQVER